MLCKSLKKTRNGLASHLVSVHKLFDEIVGLDKLLPRGENTSVKYDTAQMFNDIHLEDINSLINDLSTPKKISLTSQSLVSPPSLPWVSPLSKHGCYPQASCWWLSQASQWWAKSIYFHTTL